MQLPNMALAIPAAAAFLLTAAAMAHAEYPYSGYWDNPDEGTSMEDVARHCALSFVEQRDDGHYNTYVLDKEAFTSRGEVTYLRYASGVCTFKEDSQIESCHSLVDLTSPGDQTYLVFNVLTAIKPDRVEFAAFGSMDGARSAIRDGTVADDGNTGALVRCPISPDLLQSHTRGQLTNGTADDITALTNRGDDGLADEVLKTLTGQ